MLNNDRALIECSDLGFTYMPGTPLASEALRNINLSVEEGEVLAFIGPTGSGKSTLIQHFNGLLIPSEGKMLFKGKQIGVSIHPYEVRHEVGLVFQFPESQLFEETVIEDVSFGPRNLGLSSGEVSERAEEALESVGLSCERFAGRSPFELSGGEQRLVAIAGVLAMKPRILVLDEPTSGLDGRGKARVMQCLTELNREGMTIAFVSHDMDEVAEFARRVVVLDEGRIVLEGDPRTVFSRAGALNDIGLDIPATTELLVKLSGCGFDIATGAVSLQETVSLVRAALKEGLRL
ncbi:MAG: energy-coupling factor transporter ATPase [Candidatus Aquicultor sp.]